jgi:hypothetical protein
MSRFAFSNEILKYKGTVELIEAEFDSETGKYCF